MCKICVRTAKTLRLNCVHLVKFSKTVLSRLAMVVVKKVSFTYMPAQFLPTIIRSYFIDFPSVTSNFSTLSPSLINIKTK